MDKDDNQKTSVSITPTYGADRSGNLYGAGAEVNIRNSEISSSVGFFHTPSGTRVSGSVEKPISDSSSISLGGSKDTRGSWSISAGLSHRW